MNAAHSEYLWFLADRARTGSFSPRYNLARSEPPADVTAEFNLFEEVPQVISESIIGGGGVQLREHLAKHFGTTSDSVNVFEGGASIANYYAMKALLEPGDTVLLERPIYEPLHAVAASIPGVSIEFLERTAESRFQIDPKALINRNFRLCVLTSPHNPTAISVNNLPTLAKALDERNQKAGRSAYLLVDQVYQRLAPNPYDFAFRYGESCITTFGHAKSYRLSGMKMGILLATPDVAQTIYRYSTLCNASNSEFLEEFCLHFYQQHEQRLLERIRARYQELRSFTGKVLQEQHIQFIDGDGGFFYSIPVGGDDLQFAQECYQSTGVAVAPGSFLLFPGTIRLGFGVEALSDLQDALLLFSKFYCSWRERPAL